MNEWMNERMKEVRKYFILRHTQHIIFTVMRRRTHGKGALGDSGR